MRKRRCAPPLVACAIALATLIAPQTVSARSLITGITNPGDYSPAALAQAKETGATFIRLPLEWGGIAPLTEPASWQPENPADPNYHWGPADSAIEAVVGAGLTPVLQINDGPSWAQRCQAPAFEWIKTCDPEPAALAAFATAAARRYSGHFDGLPRVQYWQALNEPNLSAFFNPQYDTAGNPLSPILYRALVNSFYAAVKSVDPSNLVISAGLGPIEVSPWTMGPMRFARILLCMAGRQNPHPSPESCGDGVHFDIFAIQPYTTGPPIHKGKANDIELGDLGKVQALITAADRAGHIQGEFKQTPIWITEFSWDSNPPDPGGVPMPTLKRWTSEALYRAWAAGISHFFWYSLFDSAPVPGKPSSEIVESGLYFRGATVEQDQPKENLDAFRFPFVAYPRKGGLLFWGRTPNSGLGKVTIEVRRGKRWHRVAVARAATSGVFTGLAKTDYGRDFRGAARARYGSEGSFPFSMHPTHDYYQEPFG